MNRAAAQVCNNCKNDIHLVKDKGSRIYSLENNNLANYECIDCFKGIQEESAYLEPINDHLSLMHDFDKDTKIEEIF